MSISEQKYRDQEHEDDDDLVEPISSSRLVQLTFFISLSVAMRKSTLVGLFMMPVRPAAKGRNDGQDDADHRCRGLSRDACQTRSGDT